MTIPLTVIGGAAGAGKSTLVRHLMENASGYRLVAVVRDVEPLLGDGTAGARRVGDHIEWPNGCAAIGSDDPTATLATLARDAERPDHVVVEAEGAKKPRRLGGYAYMPGYRPDGTMTIVDSSASAGAFHDAVDAMMVAHLESADVILLNKVDLAGEQAAASAQRTLEEYAPSARFLWCRRGRIAPPLILGASAVHADNDDPAVVAEWRADYLPVRSRERGMLFGEQCRAWCLLADERLESREFRGWVNRLPSSIVRGSGVVHLREEPQHRHEFSLIGSRWQLQRGAPWGRDIPSTRITLVGLAARRGSAERSEPAANDSVAVDDLSRMAM